MVLLRAHPPQLVVLLVLAVPVVTGAAATVVAVLLFGNTAALVPPDAVPTWQVIVGFVLSALALFVMLAAVVSQFRTNRRLGAWLSPVAVLTRDQRKELLTQVRGQAPVQAARVPVARHLAEVLLNRRSVLVLNMGLAVIFTGQWIALRAWWYPAMAGFSGMTTGSLLAGLSAGRAAARRFLDTHPAPRKDSAA